MGSRTTASLLIGALLATLFASPAAAWRKRPRPSRAGTFDYYVLSLSWSPEHCAEHGRGPDDPQCGLERRYGFVVHGLWPQLENGYPEACAYAPGPDAATVAALADIMPSPSLVRHEWRKHGTCTGLTATAYFATLRTARAEVRIPASLERPDDTLTTNVRRIKREFGEANPEIDTDELAVLCNGRFLREVRLCLDKQLQPRACGRDVRDRCRQEPITVRPRR